MIQKNECFYNKKYLKKLCAFLRDSNITFEVERSYYTRSGVKFRCVKVILPESGIIISNPCSYCSGDKSKTLSVDIAQEISMREGRLHRYRFRRHPLCIDINSGSIFVGLHGAHLDKNIFKNHIYGEEVVPDHFFSFLEDIRYLGVNAVDFILNC